MSVLWSVKRDIVFELSDLHSVSHTETRVTPTLEHPATATEHTSPGEYVPTTKT